MKIKVIYIAENGKSVAKVHNRKSEKAAYSLYEDVKSYCSCYAVSLWDEAGNMLEMSVGPKGR